jgi:hypothetical protein
LYVAQPVTSIAVYCSQILNSNALRGSSVADGHLAKCREETETLVVAVVRLKRDFFLYVV